MFSPDVGERGNEDETRSSLRTQQQQHYCQQGCSMGVATIHIKWKTSHGVKLNNFIVKAPTTTENQDDPIIVRLLVPPNLYTFVLDTRPIQLQAPHNKHSPSARSCANAFEPKTCTPRSKRQIQRWNIVKPNVTRICASTWSEPVPPPSSPPLLSSRASQYRCRLPVHWLMFMQPRNSMFPSCT